MNLSSFILHMTISQTLIDNHVWQCVLQVIESYFSEDTLYLSLGNDRLHPEIIKKYPSIIVTKSQPNIAEDFHLKADLLVVGTTLQQRFKALRGRTIAVVKNEEDAKKFYDLHRLLSAIYIVPIFGGCQIFAFDSYNVDLNLIDTWVNGSFSKNVYLFPMKLAKQNLSVAVAECLPYLNEVDGKTIEGPAEKLISTIADKLNISVRYVFSDSIRFFRTLLKNETIGGFLKLLVENDVDLAVGCISYSAERILFADPLLLPYRTSLAWAVPAPDEQSLMDYIAKRCSLSIFPLMFIVWGLTVVVLYLSVQNTSPFSHIVFLTWAGGMMQGMANVFRSKWVNAYWQLYIFYSLLVYWLIQILITICLATVPFEREISSIDDALDRRLFVHYFEDFQKYLENSGIFMRINESGLACPASGRDMNYSLVSESKEAVIFGVRALEEFNFRQMYPNVRISSKVLFLNHQTIHMSNFMKRMHPLLPSIRRKIGFIFEAGLFDYWVKNDPKAVDRFILRPKRERKALRVNQLGIDFYLTVGLLASFIVFILEIIMNLLHYKWITRTGEGKVEVKMAKLAAKTSSAAETKEIEHDIGKKSEERKAT